MAEGVKLYKHFVDQINIMGRVKRAWFTSFNLDISFFEKYILSALVGRSYLDLKNPYDYEALNDYLANEQESLDGEKIEVKVFYDYRALQITGKPKQTSVQLHPIDTKLLVSENPDIQFTYGVFHPKVILIETFGGEYWFMVSSANLTFGGWSKNKEAFFCEKIENTFKARDIGIFFSGITNSIRGFGENPLMNKLNNGKFGQKDCKWAFYSSFNKKRFINQLQIKGSILPLRVWSPYFADKLSVIIEDLQSEYFDTIEIIPSKNDNQKIRITEISFNEVLAINGVSFKQDRFLLNQEGFVHAKIWVTSKHMAIGSWNMTIAGMNQSTEGKNNVEAGIIYDLSPKEYKSFLEEYPVSRLSKVEHSSEEDLENEKKEILDSYTLVVDLVADWDKLQLSLQGPTIKQVYKQIGSDAKINLPGLGCLSIEKLENPIDFRSHTRILLTDRFFEIEDSQGIVVYKGYLREIGLFSRPINSFENIDDYLKGWVLELPEDKEELHRLAYPVEEDNGNELSADTRKILLSNDQNAWFTSFHAFESILNRINQTRQFYAKEKLAELKKIGRVLPGSLSELRIHLENLKNTYLVDRKNFAKSPIYLWFLIEKANFVFTYFNNEINAPAESIKRIKNLNFESLFSKKEYDEIGKEGLEKWRNYVVNKLKKQ